MAIQPSFLFYLVQARYAEALSHRPSGRWPLNGWELWAAYKLGLYATVASAAWDGTHRHGGIAKAVALAACGQIDKAQEVVTQLMSRHGKGAYLTGLADALAPFAPALAQSLVAMAPGHSIVLSLALQWRNGLTDEVAQKVRQALDQGMSARYPELWLLANNALGGTPDLQLARLNAWLDHFKLPRLRLRDSTRPPSPGNVLGQPNLPAVDNGPLVTVLMTTFNAEQRVGPALVGLLNQTWRNLEVLVADDASQGNTVALVESVAARDPRVKLLRMPENVGTYAAKMAAAEAARGEFLTCHDADDWSHPLRIELQVRPLLNNPRLIATTSRWVRMEDNGMFYARPVHPLARLNPASPLFRRTIVQQRTGLWDCVRTGADSEFHARLKLVFGRRAVKRLSLPLALGSHRPDSLMNARATGYDATGVSPTRLAYWEAWTGWHIDCLRRDVPIRLPGFDEERAFAAPASITLEPARVRSAMQAATWSPSHALLG